MAGAVIAVADVTPFRRSLDERTMSLRFLLHDLRSPLNSISALTQLDASDAEAFERCGGMEQITQLARYALSLGEQFIFTSVTEHLRSRDFKRFDLCVTLRQIISQLEVTAIYCGVALHLWLPDNSPAWVSGMRNFVARAIQNVIDNALRASPRGEAVTVSLRHAGGFAEVLVNDCAGGLPGLLEGERLTDFERLGRENGHGLRPGAQARGADRHHAWRRALRRAKPPGRHSVRAAPQVPEPRRGDHPAGIARRCGPGTAREPHRVSGGMPSPTGMDR